MRTITLLSLVLPLAAFAQDDYLANDPVWTVNSVCNISFTSPGCIATDVFNYQLSGDSIINGVTYAKVVKSGTVSYAWQGGPPPLPPECSGVVGYGASLVGLIKQEGYTLLQWDGTMDQLLYDFDLEVGETLPITLNNWNTDITVSAIDEVLVGTEMRKRFTLANSWAEFMIEGIGTSHGLFEPVSNSFDCGYSLGCFGLGTEGYYPTAGPGCGLTLGAPAMVMEQERFTLSPNPVKNELTIETGEVSFTDIARLVDTQGRVVMEVPMTGPRSTVQLTHVPNGLYSVVLGKLRQRVVVAH